jgi:hypothetical protein
MDSIDHIGVEVNLLCIRKGPRCAPSFWAPIQVIFISVKRGLENATNTNLVNTYVDRSICIHIKGIVKRGDEVLTVSKN